MAVARHKLEGAFEQRKARYERATESIKQTLNAFLDDLSQRYGVREGLRPVLDPGPPSGVLLRSS
jgi:hypothetical protein